MKTSLQKLILWLPLLIFGMGFLFLVTVFLSRFSFPDDYTIVKKDDSLSLVPGFPVRQLFTATRNNLSQITMMVSNPELLPGETLTLRLKDALCRETLREAGLGFPLHAPKQYDHFVFSPLIDSEGKEYCLELAYDVPVYHRKNRPSVWTMETGNPADQILTTEQNKTLVGQTIVFHPAYREATLVSSIRELARRMGAYKANYFKGGFLLTLEFLFLLSLMLLSLILLLPKKGDSRGS